MFRHNIIFLKLGLDASVWACCSTILIVFEELLSLFVLVCTCSFLRTVVESIQSPVASCSARYSASVELVAINGWFILIHEIAVWHIRKAYLSGAFESFFPAKLASHKQYIWAPYNVCHKYFMTLYLNLKCEMFMTRELKMFFDSILTTYTISGLVQFAALTFPWGKCFCGVSQQRASTSKNNLIISRPHFNIISRETEHFLHLYKFFHSSAVLFHTTVNS
jgi:hypothetical protein